MAGRAGSLASLSRSSRDLLVPANNGWGWPDVGPTGYRGVKVNGIDHDDSIPWQVAGLIFNVLFYWDLTGEFVADAVEDAKKICVPPRAFPSNPDSICKSTAMIH